MPVGKKAVQRRMKIRLIVSWLFLVALLLAVSGSLVAGAVTPAEKESSHWKRAQALYEKSKEVILEEQQRRLLARALKTHSRHVPSLFRLGWLYQKMNLRKMAVEYYQRCVAAEPGHFSALNNLANIYKEWNRPDKAEELYRRAKNANPAYPVAPYNLGNFYRGQKKYQAARREYARALELKPDYYAAHMNLAQIYLQWAYKGQPVPPLERDGLEEETRDAWELAEEHLRAAGRARPAIMAPRYFLAVVCLNTDRREQARDHLKAVVAGTNFADRFHGRAKKLLEKYFIP